MSSLAKGLVNLRLLKAASKELTLEQLDSALEKLQQVVEQKRAEIAEQEAKQKAHLERIAEVKRVMEEQGISAEDLGFGALFETKEKKARKQLPAKYKFTDEKGEVKTWTGQGRTPLALQKALNSGKSLDDFLI